MQLKTTSLLAKEIVISLIFPITVTLLSISFIYLCCCLTAALQIAVTTVWLMNFYMCLADSLQVKELV